MATTGKILGTDFLLYVGGTAVSWSTSCSLSITGPGTTDVSNKDSNNWLEKLKNKGYGWTMSVDGMATFDGTINLRDLFDMFRNNETVTVKFSTDDAADKFYSGSAVATSFSLDAPHNDATTFSCEFEGLGGLTFIAT
jgi:predicted secreted protein